MNPIWQNNPFKTGANYRVKKSFSSFDNFIEGDVLRYEGSTYSRYDCASHFSFTDDKGKSRQWAVADDAPLEKTWRDLFEEAR